METFEFSAPTMQAKFNASNNKEHHLVLSVSGQFGAVGADEVSPAYIISMSWVPRSQYPVGFV